MAAKGSKLTPAQKRRVSKAVKAVWRRKRAEQKQTTKKIVEIPLTELDIMHTPLKIGVERVQPIDDESIQRLGKLIAAVWTSIH